MATATGSSNGSRARSKDPGRPAHPVNEEGGPDSLASVRNGSLGSNSLPRQSVDKFGFTGGDQYSEDYETVQPVEVTRRRELKWLDMLEHWNRWMNKRYKKVRERCRKGIPSSIRPRAWQYLSGGVKLMEENRNVFQYLAGQPGDSKWLDSIEKDLHRQFPWHEMFMEKGGIGQRDLYRVLKAYSIRNPVEGYCQAQAPIAALLLMHMPAEQAFWVFVSICEKYLRGYFSPGLEAIQLDGDILFALLKRYLPATYKHLTKHKVEPILCMTEWFMCIFARTLPWSSVLRVWDMFLCEGVKIIFKVAIVIFKFTLGKPEQLAACPGLYETMEKLRHIPKIVMDEEFLVSEVVKLDLSEKVMETEHNAQLLKRVTLKRDQLQARDSSASGKTAGSSRPPKKSPKRSPSASARPLSQEVSSTVLSLSPSRELEPPQHFPHRQPHSTAKSASGGSTGGGGSQSILGNIFSMPDSQFSSHARELTEGLANQFLGTGHSRGSSPAVTRQSSQQDLQQLTPDPAAAGESQPKSHARKSTPKKSPSPSKVTQTKVGPGLGPISSTDRKNMAAINSLTGPDQQLWAASLQLSRGSSTTSSPLSLKVESLEVPEESGLPTIQIQDLEEHAAATIGNGKKSKKKKSKK